jgi:hypothetical protein
MIQVKKDLSESSYFWDDFLLRFLGLKFDKQNFASHLTCIVNNLCSLCKDSEVGLGSRVTFNSRNPSSL